jgi:hypothetical protein
MEETEVRFVLLTNGKAEVLVHVILDRDHL